MTGRCGWGSTPLNKGRNPQPHGLPFPSKINASSWDARASFLPVCSTLIKDGGTGENNGFLKKPRYLRQVAVALPFF